MKSLKPDSISISRRDLLSQSLILGGLSAGSSALSAPSFVLPGACKISDIKQSQSAIGIEDSMIHIWMDGHWKGGFNQMAIFTRFPQTPESFVQKVVLTTGEKKTLGVRYFTPDHKTIHNMAPYAIFSHVDLRYSQKYFIIVQLKTGDEYKIYRYTIEKKKAEPTTLNGSRIPSKLAGEFNQTHGGQVFSSYHFPLALIKKDYCKSLAMSENLVSCYIKHFPQLKIRSINSNGNFNIDVSFQQPDVSPEHYIRYILITDPVGRLMSIFKRTFGDYNTLTVSMKNGSDNYWKANWDLEKDQIPFLPDCPYIMVFTENVKNGLFQNILWLH